jgi:hypothetical protein
MRLLFAAIVAAMTSTAAAQKALDYPALLHRLVDVDWLWYPPAEGERCVQWSSYDRGSDAGPGTPGWYANHDRGHYLRVEQRDGSKEYVMVDAQGPGCVARIWSANPSGTLHFDVDGQRVWSVDMAALLAGKVEGVPEPLAGMRSRGGNCYLPIPFRQSLRISATAGDLYYLVDVVRYPEKRRVPSFAPELLADTEESGEALLETKAFLEKGFRSTLPDAWAISMGSITAGTPRSACDVWAGYRVETMSLRVRSELQPEELARVLGSILLVMSVGDEETIRVPVRDFFGGGSRWTPWRSYLLGVEGDGSAYCYFPMPCPVAGRIELLAEGDLRGATVELGVTVAALPVTFSRPMLFRASYHLAKATPTRPFSDHLVLDAEGKGRFVGCSLLVRNPSRVWWGEGDEKITVDGEKFPSWFGTGTEDYFGYAWCDPTPFQAPFHAQIECQGPDNFGFTQLHRTHVLDSVPFQQSLRFELERWHWLEQAKMDYATVAYWYGAAGATSGLPPVPPVEQRHLERLERPPVWVAQGALEGEALRVLECTRGTHEVQDLGLFEQRFSRNAHRWWRDGEPGDAIVLAVPVEQAGRYRVTAGFVTADDFGIVQCSLAGQALGEPFDGYSKSVLPSGPRELGVARLAAGEAELRLELTGRNPASKQRHMVGLDWVRLELVE